MSITDGDPAGRAGPGREIPVRVVIIEDLRDVREGLAVLIDGTRGFRCAGSYRTMEDAELFSSHPNQAENACCTPETMGKPDCCVPS